MFDKFKQLGQLNKMRQQASSLQKELNKNFMTDIKELSMGMTNDYKMAVECGATMIRIGKGLFKD